VGGRGSGKSYVGAYDLLCRAMSERGRGRLYMVVAPTYIILQDASMRTVVQIAEDLGVIKEKWKQPPRLVLHNGSEIIFRSGDDPEKLRGPNLSGVWMDEASLMSQEAYSVCIACLREAGQAGWLSATFTPKGVSHWTYDVFAKNKPNTQLFRSSTTENPFLPGEFITALKGQYSDKQASQEISGEFVDQEGCEWPSSHFSGHIWFDEWPDERKILVKSIGLDPSKGQDSRHGDYCALVKLARTDEGVIYCEAELSRIDAETIVSNVCHEQQVFNADAVVIESNQFQHLLASQVISESRKRHINMPVMSIHNRVNKEVRIRRLGPHLANKNLRFRANHEGTRMLVNQLREFPLSRYDDGPDALEMALRGMITLHNGRVSASNNSGRGIRA
jgi:predicted phage terminase large subunit-like protein